MKRKYKVIDVFSSIPLLGNPVAVILDSEGLTDDQMQKIARWTNLSETTFVLKAKSDKADYFLRIFTPENELQFAGHPTLGSAYAILEAGICKPKNGILVQECGVGLITIKCDTSNEHMKLTLQMPESKQRTLSESEITELNLILGHNVLSEPSPSVIDVGIHWIVAQVESTKLLLDVKPDFARSAAFERRLDATGITIYSAEGSEVEVRSFAPSTGSNEDPVCGSGNGSVAIFRLKAGQISNGSTYVARQGRQVHRDGYISINITSDGAVLVGGECVTTVEGLLLV